MKNDVIGDVITRKKREEKGKGKLEEKWERKLEKEESEWKRVKEEKGEEAIAERARWRELRGQGKCGEQKKSLEGNY